MGTTWGPHGSCRPQVGPCCSDNASIYWYSSGMFHRYRGFGMIAPVQIKQLIIAWITYKSIELQLITTTLYAMMETVLLLYYITHIKHINCKVSIIFTKYYPTHQIAENRLHVGKLHNRIGLKYSSGSYSSAVHNLMLRRYNKPVSSYIRMGQAISNCITWRHEMTRVWVIASLISLYPGGAFNIITHWWLSARLQ